MTKQRRQYSPEFKFNVALEAAKGRKTISELASEMQVHPTQVSEWKGQLPAVGLACVCYNSAGRGISEGRNTP